jgi:lipopolysaccharide biosynthesis protein/ubiquinone/menaquinone biosynthesis C-methylase UbiE
MSSNSLAPDGERFLPQFKGIIELEHYHRYFMAQEVVASKDVLDIASGEGFGSAILSRTARSVIGVDISTDAVEHARSYYTQGNLRFIHGSATEIPIPEASADVVVSFETIEHLIEHDKMMSEIKRVLRPDGCLIISSPNKAIYTDRANYTNRFHLRELYTPDFMALVSRYFFNVCHYGQRVTTSSVITSESANGSFKTYSPGGAASGIPDQLYDIIIGSDAALPVLGPSIYEQPYSALQPHNLETINKTVEEKQAHVTRLEAEISRLTKEFSQSVEGLRKEVEEKRALADNSREEIIRVNHDYQRLASALNRAMRDGQTVVRDKWWRRTEPLRTLSNKVRKWKGKQEKVWPTQFLPGNYLDSGEVVAASARVPSTIDDYDPAIPRIEFSKVSEEYVPYTAFEGIETIPKLIAFYLPQFHPFPENDAWWGKGFTEWTNVGKAKPLFPDHHQPHCPIHLGYYDLRLPQVMEEQAKLAREHGVSGFAYYFYWFAGKVLMEQPLKQMLANHDVDMPFCMIWANENWSRRWDGMDKDILIEQNHSLSDSCSMLDYLRPFMSDPRYIMVDGRPLFIVYRPELIPDMAQTISAWRDKAADFGFPGIYVVCAQVVDDGDPRKYGFDAAMEFPPHKLHPREISDSIDFLDPAFSGGIYSYDDAVTKSVKRPNDAFKRFPTAMLSWDNTARKKERGHIFAGFSVTKYSQWLSANAERTVKDERLSRDEKLIFVNAWNEWAEGTHLEPDQKHGYGYLTATREVMQNYAVEGAQFLSPVVSLVRGSSIALIIHVHFAHVWPDLVESVGNLLKRKPDIYITVTSLALARMVNADFPDAVVEIVDNRSRDIRPFLILLKRIQPLGYAVVCKVHGKASLHRKDGDMLRQRSLNGLLSEVLLDNFLQHPEWGMLALQDSLLSHDNDSYMAANMTNVKAMADELGLRSWRGTFPAGSMFWFRPAALAPLLRLSLDDFDIERGLADGTRAHAVERLFCSVCQASGYEVGTA